MPFMLGSTFAARMASSIVSLETGRGSKRKSLVLMSVCVW